MEYGCIGEHLKHSFSKEIHSLLSDYDYEIKEIPKENLEEFMTRREFKAINVTIPYKLQVIPYLDNISEVAKSIGAVNTITNKNCVLSGFNTDFHGLKALILREGIELENKKVLILGSGGTSKTAKAVAESLKAKEIIRTSRNAKQGFVTYEEAYKHHLDTDVIINTTPVGMYPNIEGSAIDIERFSSLIGVVDAIYNPLRSELVLKARERGIKASGGLYMLVAQAAFAYEKFTDKALPFEKIQEVYEKVLQEKENIVLIGMPASGKTTIGKKVARKMGREFIDSDKEIEKKTGMKIPEIFEKYGEEHFRRIETEVIKEISVKSGVVIATGGGAVLNPNNIFSLSKNGRIYFLDRPLEKLICTPNRPLSSSRELLEKRYNQRYQKYLDAADVRIEAQDSIKGNTDAIIEEFRRKNESNNKKIKSEG